MTHTVTCSSASLAKALLSNLAHDRKGVMLLVCDGKTFGWPMPVGGYDEGPKRGMEVA
jgi:hypothetical protein